MKLSLVDVIIQPEQTLQQTSRQTCRILNAGQFLHGNFLYLLPRSWYILVVYYGIPVVLLTWREDHTITYPRHRYFCTTDYLQISHCTAVHVLWWEQPAYTAKVSRTKDNQTLLATSFSRPPFVALQTFHLLHLLPVQTVSWLCFIMAKPAVVNLLTARCHQSAMSLVVFTPKFLSPFIAQMILHDLVFNLYPFHCWPLLIF